MTRTCFAKILQLLPSMGAVGEEHQQACMECMRSLYQAAERMPGSELGRSSHRHWSAFWSGGPSTRYRGAALGLLYGGGGGSRGAASRIFPQDGSGEAPGDEGCTASGRIRAAAAGYIQGTRKCGRGVPLSAGPVFYRQGFRVRGRGIIRLIDELLGRLSAEEFMSLLPELRLAFSYFTPMETDRIARKAAGLHGKKAGDILRRQGISRRFMPTARAWTAESGRGWKCRRKRRAYEG